MLFGSKVPLAHNGLTHSFFQQLDSKRRLDSAIMMREGTKSMIRIAENKDEAGNSAYINNNKDYERYEMSKSFQNK